MNVGRVIGTVVATTAYEGLADKRFLVVQPVDRDLKPTGKTLVAADAVQSGEGDLILYVNSREAALGLDPTFVPVDATIIGHVDAVGDKKELP